ncbi:MAG: magnesium/cobalt transporter CorA, partial [Candidatus Omnitrophica bacterium]|nr:magnesium/cobalt transporter CorA [Candidatus Omnitrophota bacterium]
PKMEDFGSYIYMVMKMLSYNQAEAEVEIEQVSMILGNNFLISFQEKEGDVFDSIRERIRTAKGRIRKSGVDYLVYTLIDAVIDNYFLILEKIGEKIEVLEEELINTPTQETMRNIHSLKREMIFLRKSVWPMRELINGLQKSESSVIKKSTGIFLRDVYDHTIQVIDTVESLRDMASGMLDIYLSSISNRMNEVMKVLTIFAAIFIPLTFIAGVYGMNFKFMPELEWKYGYFVALSLMAAVGITLVLFFKRKKWF